MKQRTVNLIELNVAVLMWGLTAQFSKGIHLPVSQIICLRALVAAVVLLVFLRVMRSTAALHRPRHLGIMIVLGVLLCLHWLTFFKALKISNSAVTLLSLHTYPVFTALVEPLVFREKFRPSDLAVAALVFTGVVIMMPAFDLSNRISQGILLGVVSGLFWMGRNLLTRKYVRHYSGSALMFYQTLVAGVVLLPALSLARPAAYSTATVGLLLLLGVVFTAVPQALFAASLKTLSAKTASILATLLPFYGAFWGYVIYRETVTPRTAIGGAIILACVIFETLRSVRGDAAQQLAAEGQPGDAP